MARLFKNKIEKKKGLWRRVVDLALTDVRVAAGGMDHESLEQLANRLDTPSQPVLLVNQADGFDWEKDTVSDKVHPNAQGAEKMADRWFEALTEVQTRECPDASAEVERMFGFRAFADRFDRMVQSFEASETPAGPDGNRYESAGQTLVEGFADLEYLRLLFAPMGHSHG